MSDCNPNLDELLSDHGDLEGVLEELMGSDNYQELCLKCGRVTSSEIIQHAAGTEFVCKVCGTQTDFLHVEERE